MKIGIKVVVAVAAIIGFGSQALAQSSCAKRGALDAAYCDANGDLVADTPAQTVEPAQLALGLSSVEDSHSASKAFWPLVEYLGVCLKRPVVLHTPMTEASVLEGMRKGQVHVAQFATGATMFAVNFAGAVPFAGKGLSTSGKRDSYTLMLLVRADSPYHKPSDLVGKRVAHTSEASNSGNLAPRVLLPKQGLRPDVDYQPIFSGKHDKSIMGVKMGLYDGAPIASDVYDRLLAKNEIKRNEFRVIYESEPFPPDGFSHAHNLSPKLAAEIAQCFYDFKAPEFMARQLEGNDRFYPLNYKQDWDVVRRIAEESKRPVDRAAYDKLVSGKK